MTLAIGLITMPAYADSDSYSVEQYIKSEIAPKPRPSWEQKVAPQLARRDEQIAIAERERQAKLKAEAEEAARVAASSEVRVSQPLYADGVGGILGRIRYCESSNNYRATNGTHFGAYQFDLSTWASVGGSGNPMDASPAEQDMRANLLYQQRGTQPWLASKPCWGA